MVAPDPLGFDLEHGQVVDAALAAAAGALEPGRVAPLEGRGPAVHGLVQPLKLGESPLGACRF
jgi:hypothetical protein